jgi:hypothetical protein
MERGYQVSRHQNRLTLQQPRRNHVMKRVAFALVISAAAALFSAALSADD